MDGFYVINIASGFYTHSLGTLVSWGPLNKANVFCTAMSAKYISEKYPDSRVVEVKRKRIIEIN